MKKSIVIPLAAALAAVATAPVFATTVTRADEAPFRVECKLAAKKDHISTAKMGDYLRTCVQKHEQELGG